MSKNKNVFDISELIEIDNLLLKVSCEGDDVFSMIDEKIDQINNIKYKLYFRKALGFESINVDNDKILCNLLKSRKCWLNINSDDGDNNNNNNNNNNQITIKEEKHESIKLLFKIAEIYNKLENNLK